MMPQLDFATFPSQLFWLAVNFALLYWLMTKIALPRVGNILQSRAAAIKADLAGAAKLKAEAENILLNYDKTLAEAKNRARYLIKQATDDIQFEQTKQMAALEKKLESRMMESQNKLHAAKTKVLQEIKPLSAELADVMVKKLLHQILDNGDDKQIMKKEAIG